MSIQSDTSLAIYGELLHKIESRAALIGVVGLGYVGLPLAARAGRIGFPVLGFDVGREKVDRLNRGESHIGDVPSELIADLRAQAASRPAPTSAACAPAM